MPPRTRTTDAAFDWLPAALWREAPTRALRPGEALFRQGDRARAIYAVEQGRLRLLRHTVDSHPVTLHTARAGRLFPEAALFSDIYHCDAVADVAASVRRLDKRRLLAALRADPALAERFMAMLAREVMGLRTRLEQRNIRSARERVLQHLALNVSAHSGADGGTVRLQGTLMDLAAEIGLTHETLYRTLAALEREGLIRRDAGSIVLLRAARRARRRV